MCDILVPVSETGVVLPSALNICLIFSNFFLLCKFIKASASNDWKTEEKKLSSFAAYDKTLTAPILQKAKGEPHTVLIYTKRLMTLIVAFFRCFFIHLSNGSHFWKDVSKIAILPTGVKKNSEMNSIALVIWSLTIKKQNILLCCIDILNTSAKKAFCSIPSFCL